MNDPYLNFSYSRKKIFSIIDLCKDSFSYEVDSPDADPAFLYILEQKLQTYSSERVTGWGILSTIETIIKRHKSHRERSRYVFQTIAIEALFPPIVKVGHNIPANEQRMLLGSSLAEINNSIENDLMRLSYNSAVRFCDHIGGELGGALVLSLTRWRNREI